MPIRSLAPRQYGESVAFSVEKEIKKEFCLNKLTPTEKKKIAAFIKMITFASGNKFGIPSLKPFYIKSNGHSLYFTMVHLIRHIRESLQPYLPPSEISAISRVICCEMLGVSTGDYFMRSSLELTDDQRAVLDSTLKRLKNHEPLQYIQEEAPFLGLRFKVTPAVLIPRPETAELVEFIIKNEPQENLHVLDIGTGSGCIAVSLKLSLKDATAFAWDISPEALEIASRNARDLHAEVTFDRVDCLSGELPQVPSDLDIIVSNPPYITPAEQKEMEENVMKWEPHKALFVPQDRPLLFYEHIADIAGSRLRDEGRLYLEINQAYGGEICRLLEGKGFCNIHLHKDLSGKDRYISSQYHL